MFINFANETYNDGAENILLSMTLVFNFYLYIAGMEIGCYYIKSGISLPITHKDCVTFQEEVNQYYGNNFDGNFNKRLVYIELQV